MRRPSGTGVPVRSRRSPRGRRRPATSAGRGIVLRSAAMASGPVTVARYSIGVRGRRRPRVRPTTASHHRGDRLVLRSGGGRRRRGSSSDAGSATRWSPNAVDAPNSPNSRPRRHLSVRIAASSSAQSSPSPSFRRTRVRSARSAFGGPRQRPQQFDAVFTDPAQIAEFGRQRSARRDPDDPDRERQNAQPVASPCSCSQPQICLEFERRHVARGTPPTRDACCAGRSRTRARRVLRRPAPTSPSRCSAPSRLPGSSR